MWRCCALIAAICCKLAFPSAKRTWNGPCATIHRLPACWWICSMPVSHPMRVMARSNMPPRCWRLSKRHWKRSAVWTKIEFCGASSTSSKPPCVPTFSKPTRRANLRLIYPSNSIPRASTRYRCRVQCSRFSCIRHAWRRYIYAVERWRVAACVGRIGVKISAPRCWD